MFTFIGTLVVFFELPVMTLKIRGVFSREAVMDTLCVAYTSKAKLQQYHTTVKFVCPGAYLLMDNKYQRFNVLHISRTALARATYCYKLTHDTDNDSELMSPSTDADLNF